MYLSTTTGSSVFHSPPPDKGKLFYLLVCRGTLSCHGVGAFSLYPSWHAPNGSSPNPTSFGWSVIPAGCTSQKSLGRIHKISLFPSPYHQTISPYLWPMTPPRLISPYLLTSFHVCPKSARRSCVCRSLEACLHSLPPFFVLWCGLFYNSLLPLGARLYLILDFTFLLTYFLIAIMSCPITLLFLL